MNARPPHPGPLPKGTGRLGRDLWTGEIRSRPLDGRPLAPRQKCAGKFEVNQFVAAHVPPNIGVSAYPVP
jgi:hypothetical protein